MKPGNLIDPINVDCSGDEATISFERHLKEQKELVAFADNLEKKNITLIALLERAEKLLTESVGVMRTECFDEEADQMEKLLSDIAELKKNQKNNPYKPS